MASLLRFLLPPGPLVRALALALALLGLAAHCGPAAQAQQPSSASGTLVKAAFLHKFASFVEWPEGAFARPDTPLKIGVIGDDQVLQDLDELARDRDRDGRRVVATRLVATDSFAGFHILYIRVAGAARIADVLSHVPEGVLTVADTDGPHPRGAVMSFFLEDGRVRFGVSLEAASRAKLRLNPRLLSVARSV